MKIYVAKQLQKCLSILICSLLLLSACASVEVAEKGMEPVVPDLVEDKKDALSAQVQQAPLQGKETIETDFFSLKFGLITAEQSAQFQQVAISNPAQKAMSIWPVFSQHQDKITSIYDPNFIVSNYQFQKAARLKYQAIMDYRIQNSGISRLAGETDANLHLYTLFSVVKTAPGKTTLEYWIGASDWKYAQTLSDQSELSALLNTTIWCVVVREILDDAQVETDGAPDEAKLLARLIAMSGAAMDNFLISQEQLERQQK